MTDIAKAMAKIRKPPSVPNWAKHNSPRTDKTARAIAYFALGTPRAALQPVYDLVAMMVIDQQPLEVALRAADKILNPHVHRAAVEIVTAFAKFNRHRKMDGIQALHGWETVYPLARGVIVPVKPSFIILENGRPKPVFLIGWSSTKLDVFQKRLLCTVINDAVLTRQEFLGGDAEILCFPKSGRFARDVISWSVKDAWHLSPQQLSRQIEVYGSALDQVPGLMQRILERRAQRMG